MTVVVVVCVGVVDVGLVVLAIVNTMVLVERFGVLVVVVVQSLTWLRFLHLCLC